MLPAMAGVLCSKITKESCDSEEEKKENNQKCKNTSLTVRK
jgi:hypothetical protein